LFVFLVLLLLRLPDELLLVLELDFFTICKTQILYFTYRIVVDFVG